MCILEPDPLWNNRVFAHAQTCCLRFEIDNQLVLQLCFYGDSCEEL